MIQLLQDALQIHLTRSQPINALATEILSTDEQKKAAAFLFEADRQLYATAHVFLRQTLSRYAQIAPRDWRFHVNQYGKPEIVNDGCQAIQFNLSHTQGLVAVALTLNQPVGVDIEQGDRSLRDLAALSRHVFAQQEAADVLSGDDPETQRHKFFTYWTLKEAYIKARGMGMSLPLKKFRFIRDQAASERWTLICDPEIQDHGDQWLCHAKPLSEHYFLAYVTRTGINLEKIQLHMTDNQYQLPFKANSAV